MESKITVRPRGTISAVVTRANGDIEDLGVIASTEDATLAVDEASPGLLRQLRAAWVEGWHEGTEEKEGGE